MRTKPSRAVTTIIFLIAILSSCSSTSKPNAPMGTEITYPSADGLLIHATIYKQADSLPWIVLCHQARYSRGEFIEIAPKLNQLGYNCIACDARSGNEVNGVVNETAKAAKQAGKPTDYFAAQPDIEASVLYASKLAHGKIILLGSSYSASLALTASIEHPEAVRAVLAYSPGEYFEQLNIHNSIKRLAVPTFVSSALSESADVATLFNGIAGAHITRFVPKQEGIHGASELWSTTPNNAEYWAALKEFLKRIG